MKYITAGEAAHRLGVSDKTFRKMVRDGKLSFHRVHPTRIEIPESEIERLISERSQQTAQSGEDTGMLSRLALLEAKVAELEAAIQELQRDKADDKPSVSIFSYDETPPEPTRSESQKKAVSRQATQNSDLPPGCVFLKAFAIRHGVPANTAKRHHVVGFFNRENSTYDRLDVSSRPKTNRPGETTYYLTPEQQEKALAYWRHYGTITTEDG